MGKLFHKKDSKSSEYGGIFPREQSSYSISSLASSNGRSSRTISSNRQDPSMSKHSLQSKSASLDLGSSASKGLGSSNQGTLSMNDIQKSPIEPSINHEILYVPIEGTSARGSNQDLNSIDQSSETKSKKFKSGNGGFLTSIMNSAANIMSSSSENGHDNEHSFSNKLDSLLKPARHEKLSQDSLNVPSDNKESEEDPAVSQLGSAVSTNSVQFESVRESPLKTLGEGNLDLSSFDKRDNIKRSDSGKRPISLLSPGESTENLIKANSSPDIVNRQLPVTNQLVVSGNQESRRVHRKSLGQYNTEKNRSSGNLSKGDGDLSYDSDTESEQDKEIHNLDTVVDYKNIKYTSRKKDKEYHRVFKRIPISERLIEECSCALSKDILVHGKIYLSEHYLCFNSNILGWVTNLIIPLQEVIQIEKKSTAVLFPNGIIIRTLRQKYVFASFLSRDTLFSLITSLWNRVLLEKSDIDPNKLIRISSSPSAKRSRAGSRSIISKSVSRDELESSSGISNNDDEVYSSSSEITDIDRDKEDLPDLDNKKSSSSISNTPSKNNSATKEDGSSSNDNFNGLPLVGPLEHAPVNMDYKKQQNETFIIEKVLKAPIGAVFQLLFGSNNSKYVKILKNQKNFDITEGDITEISPSNKERAYSYIKPLSGPIGPKQTKCNIVDKLLEFELDSHILVEQCTSTPDVPSGNSFSIKTRIFLSWAEDNSTKLYVLTGIEWTGKSWIKSAIEKGSIDGQKDSMKILAESIEDFISQGSSAPSSKSKKKSKRRKSLTDKMAGSNEVAPSAETKSIPEQITQLLNSVGELLPIPFIDSYVRGILISIVLILSSFQLFSLLFYTRSSKTTESADRVNFFNENVLYSPTLRSYSNEKAFWEENESSLWDWIETRSGGRLKHENMEDSSLRSSEHQVKEIVELTKLRLEEISNHLSH